MSHDRSIHLLYVPTLFCNLSCSYCYLGEQTDTAKLREDAAKAVSTLSTALSKFSEASVLPFNVSLHGGEATTMPLPVLDELFGIIRSHYLRNYDEIASLGHRKTNPHIKTNLYKFAPLYDLFCRHKVSISASIDLPLALHAQHRTTRNHDSWIERTQTNLKLLAQYPHAKKISCTLSAEHLADHGAIIEDIWRIHREFGLDMNAMNIMFAFPSELNAAKQAKQARHTLTPATSEQQRALRDSLTHAFRGTELEEGLLSHWFDEFTPSYCTNALNCGEKFFLLQSDGEIYSCVRGQGVPELRYGNIFTDSVADILDAGSRKVSAIHQSFGFSSDCKSCSSLKLCNTGCPAVKLQTQTPKSYTCELQKDLYRDFPARFPTPEPAAAARYAAFYAKTTHPALAFSSPEPEPARAPEAAITPEIHEQRNALRAIIEADPLLARLYEPGAFVLLHNGKAISLESQILKSRSAALIIGPSDTLSLHFSGDLWSQGDADAHRNTLHLQALRDTPVIYGDEARKKQEHLFTHQAYLAALEPSTLIHEGFQFDLAPLLALHAKLYKKGVLNNFFASTSALREHHYARQKSNAFYHIQALNLPFHNFEFHYLPPRQGD